MEVAFGRRAVADPAHRDPAVALDRRCHRPADRLRELGAEIARDGEEAVRLVRIHDRQLAAVQLVAGVRVDLAHHLRQRIAARDQQPLLAIGREIHVLAVERGGGGDRDRLLARRLHVEAGLPLPLGAVHAVVEHPHRDHVAKDLAQGVGVELGVPRADRAMLFVEHAHQVRGQPGGFRRRSADVGPRRGCRRRGFASAGEIGRVAGPERGSGTCSESCGRLGCFGVSLSRI